MGMLCTAVASAAEPVCPLFQNWTPEMTLLAVLVIMNVWLVFAQHRLARNQVQIGRMIEEVLAGQAAQRSGERTEAGPPPSA